MCGFIIKQSKWPPPIRTIVSDVSSFPSSMSCHAVFPVLPPDGLFSPFLTNDVWPQRLPFSETNKRRFRFDTQHLADNPCNSSHKSCRMPNARHRVLALENNTII
ncbi:hypothetical protein M419DRAFT_124514 [Trichoderma reesei RUT C-30]|uniref:Uncharacterized protein n=1 Tax=Hypocrea jecorina (strain ATCC 56765 / BCRC 32924 / NRRL 11460 / Rut C-30) TaxID=1344414 RepID=A0A024S3V9_HYPJR|nr:hypothetical protein M419DRAFT_124514 [Trichoderma reesei RUT C-30]